MTNKNSFLPEENRFQHNLEGKQVQLFYLKNDNIQVALTNYGCRIVSLLVKDKEKRFTDVVVGFDSTEDYLNASEFYYGAIIGRYANRIAKGKFSLEKQAFTLATNNGNNHLHGGVKGFHDVVWDVKEVTEKKIIFSYLSKDGEEGYPGNLQVTVTYSITDNAELKINFDAVTDKTTVINLTNHAYFNLNGQGSGDILNHQLYINADHYTPIDEELIPLGVFEHVDNTPFDFTKETAIGERIEEDFTQLKYGKGYDHNFVLNKEEENELTVAARATGDTSGITIEVLTTEPGIQLYTGNFMKGDNILKGGHSDELRTAFCLETQHYPDSPNQKNFPSTILGKDEKFNSTTIFRFL